jgi:hypothetical protein
LNALAPKRRSDGRVGDAVTSAATMVYDAQPMRDHFRRIDDKTVLGAMEKYGAKGPGFFYLTLL